ncbi:hypothetical protein EJ04DRAFT_512226 [Polyplosphaeria fusca]|uniref:Glycosyltransferase family 69 protein n=1 Tax=Polyplosphaeria fusca TaxID=682080 RepID=A0A9P4QVP6_9PLEO|nr:hypothetical protein EJ04DRAFT_512226 [Polyplosphaeria fusca]
MSSTFRRAAHDYEPLPRTSLDDDHVELKVPHPSWTRRLRDAVSGVLLPSVKNISNPSAYAHLITPRRRKRSLLRLIYYSIFSIPYLCLALVLVVGIFFPSYTHRPGHYDKLRQIAQSSTSPGRANIRHEKVFIAASIYEVNGTLSDGAWGQSVLDLVDLLGPDNVYLSIYENDPDALTKASLAQLKSKVTCNASVVFEDLDLATIPRTELPSGETRIKRIAFLAEVRNRALAPIDSVDVAFDRLLFINDVNFDPVEAAQLLFSTNVDANGRAEYGAACAVDFINPFKFYDRFATRDMEGHNMGIPFYPWFTSAGDHVSRSDVMSGSDAVRVRSCWGGMTAFEAKWFQDLRASHANEAAQQPTSPLRFRYEEETYWESSECCLINADLQYRRTGKGMPEDSGIYMNPYVRVAYDTKTLSWLSLSRRPERLYSLIHDILNHWVGFPQYDPRQTEEPGTTINDRIWIYDHPKKALAPDPSNEDLAGHWEDQQRIAKPGGFCGGRNLLVLNEKPEDGEGKWRRIAPPSMPIGA